MGVAGLDTLPPWLQVILSILCFCVAISMYLAGWLKKLPPPPKDVVVPSLTIADTDSMRELTSAIRNMVHTHKEMCECTREQVFLLQQINGHLEAIKHQRR